MGPTTDRARRGEGSVRDTIPCPPPVPDRETRRAQIFDFINALPGGYVLAADEATLSSWHVAKMRFELSTGVFLGVRPLPLS